MWVLEWGFTVIGRWIKTVTIQTLGNVQKVLPRGWVNWGANWGWKRIYIRIRGGRYGAFDWRWYYKEGHSEEGNISGDQIVDQSRWRDIKNL